MIASVVACAPNESPASPRVPATDTTTSASILDRNLRALARTSPRAARLIAGSVPATGIEWIEAPDGGASAVYRGRALASRRRPVEEARRLAGSVDLREAATVVFLGMGLGHHVAQMAARGDRQTLIIVFEPDLELLRSVLERIDLSAAFDGASILLVTDEADGATLAGQLRGAEALIAVGVRIVEHAPSKPRLGERAGAFTQTLASTVESLRTTVITTMVQTEITIRNALMNARAYCTGAGVGELENLCAGRLGVVVAAGPSLHRNLHLLEDPEVRARVLVVGVQTVLKPMLERGIKPDIVTALDHHEISRRFYENLSPEDVEGITLIAEPKANAAIIDAWPGALRLIDTDVLDQALGKDLAGEHAPLEAGAPVAHLAYYVARYMGCDPVALIGQDLAFTDGQYYAPGAAIHNVWACELNAFNTLETMEWQRIARARANLRERRDHLGRAVYTDDQMATYLAQFERDFASDADRGLTTIDATEGGVRKAHTTVMTLAQALERFAPEGAGPLAELPMPSPNERPSRVRRLRRKLDLLAADADRVVSLSREAEALLERMEGMGGDQASLGPLIDRVHEIRARVERIRPAYDLVHRINQTGTFKRFRADRELSLDVALTPLEEQRKRIARDRLNVSWLADAAETLSALLGASSEALPPTEAPKLTSDIARAGEAGGALPRARVLGLILDRGADPSLALRTRRRLERCAGLEAIEARGVEATARGRAARAWAGACWRGGLGGATVWDEVFDPKVALEAMRESGCDSALIVGADWGLVDPGLCERLVERHRTSAEARSLAFCQAAPGLAGCVISAELCESLAAGREAGDRLATIGGVLGYRPMRPRPDAIATAACLGIDPAVRDAMVRLIPDEPLARAILGEHPDAGAAELALAARTALEIAEPAPREVVLEVTTRRDGPAGAAGAIDMDRATLGRLMAELGAIDGPVALTLAGRGDPLLHPEAPELLDLCVRAGLAGVHVRTELLVDADRASAPGRAGVDVLSIDMHADSSDAYARIRGTYRHAEVVANVERLLRDSHASGGPWIVPRILRTDEAYPEIEGLFDRSMHCAGACVIDQLARPRAGERIGPLGKPGPVRWRDARRRVLILADGAVPSDEREPGSSVGSAIELGVLGAWRELARIRESAQRDRDSIIESDTDPLWTGW